jgi:trimeric autotransporter adhesin
MEVARGNNARGVATVITLLPGTYRESVHLQKFAGQTDAPLALRARQPGAAVVSGSEVFSGWTAMGNDTYTHAWPHDFGTTPNPWAAHGIEVGEVVRRREMVFVDGTLLTPVLSEAALVPGTFHVDEAADRITMRVAAGTDVRGATVEVAVRAGLFKAAEQSNVTISGLIFQHDASPLQGSDAISLPGSRNVLIEDTFVRWNSQGGINLSRSTNVVLRRVDTSHNGTTGTGGWRVKALAMEGVTATANNWRGALADFTGWSIAGTKLLYAHDVLLRDYVGSVNHTYGLWLDTDAANVLIENARIDRNANDGLFLEALVGPVTIRNTAITGNLGHGILVGNAGGVTLAGCTLAGNYNRPEGEGAQIMISGTPGGRWDTDHETGQNFQAFDDRWMMTGNTLRGTTPRQLLIATTFGEADWRRWTGTLTASGNTYAATADRPFRRDGAVRMSLADWRAYTAQDADAKWVK